MEVLYLEIAMIELQGLLLELRKERASGVFTRVQAP